MVPAEAREGVGFPELALPTAVCDHVGSGKPMGIKASTLTTEPSFQPRGSSFEKQLEEKINGLTTKETIHF